jgi:hypothetical protein
VAVDQSSLDEAAGSIAFPTVVARGGMLTGVFRDSWIRFEEECLSKFRIAAFSDDRYDEMTVEIQYDGEQIAQLNMDRGAEAVEVQLLGPPFVSGEFEQRFMLDEFVEALSLGKARLLSYLGPASNKG